jgi:hypothetical protein
MPQYKCNVTERTTKENIYGIIVHFPIYMDDIFLGGPLRDVSVEEAVIERCS